MASFQSASISFVSGTFAGSLSGATFGTHITAPLTLAQSTPLASSDYPATATLNVTGVSCFKSGTHMSSPATAIAGDSITSYLKRDDDSEVEIDGVTNSSANKIETAFFVLTGNCALASASGLLQEQ